MSQPVSDTTLYESIGGQPAVSAAVDRFYDRVLACVKLKSLSNGISMSRLKTHLLSFQSEALGGPKRYSDASMRDAHRRLAMEQRYRDGVDVHLVKMLR